MRYLYACFKGYIGFYNGLGLDKVEIDFSKCKYDIILIHGINGCGKSTLMNSLNPFPDPSSSFVPERDAEKILTIFDNGDLYNIRIVSPCGLKGERKQTKAFISKNGLELNDNGNITSYKEIIFSEFELDSNFISLSKLSVDDRGLGDKTPSERKKFAANIVDNLETYNDIYKTLNKKSLIFKSHINTLHTKIQNIGMKDALEGTLNQLKQKENSLNSRIMELNNLIVAIEAKSSIDEEEALRIKQINDKYNEIENIISLLMTEIKSLVHKTKIKEIDIEKKYNEDSELYKYYQSKISELKSIWIDKTKRMVNINDSINSLEADIVSLSSNLDQQLELKYTESNDKIKAIETELVSLNIDPSIDIFVLKQVLDCYEYFIRQIESIYEFADTDMLEYITKKYNPNIIEDITIEIYNLQKSLQMIDAEINIVKSNIDKVSVLKDRPKNCNNNSCPFISSSIDIEKKFGNMEKLTKMQMGLEKERDRIKQNIQNLELSKDKYYLWNKEAEKLLSLLAHIKENQEYLIMVNDNVLSNTDIIILGVSNMSSFNDIRDPKRIRDAWNLIEILKKEREVNISLSYEYKSFNEKVQLINSSNNILDKQKSERDQLSIEINDLKKELDSYQNLLSSLESRIEDETRFNNIYHQFIEKSKEKNEVEKEINIYKSKSSKALEQLNNIQNYRMEIDRLSNECRPITIDIQKISGQLTLLESYYIEYEQYKEKYNMIETLKKYCSPTGGGIQTIFMQLYMSKTLELSNQVLGMLFGGEYRLLDFIINQNEFRIPFVGSGLPVDDISSGSNSQICIMGTVINLVLLHQASTKYNIARLDEVDGGLDSRNRSEFVNFLFRVKSILQIEQLFAISHSLEADTSCVDIIKLKTYNEFGEYANLTGNIIYDYDEELKKTFN